MSNSILITYELDPEAGLDLDILGQSFSGMKAVLNDICNMAGINGEVEIKTTKITQGSIDIHNILYVTTAGLPFENAQDLYDFLKVVSPEMLKFAQGYMSNFMEGHKTLNDYFKENAFDNSALTLLLAPYIPKMLEWGAKQKKQLTLRDEKLGEIPEKQAKRLRSMVLHGRYNKALKALTEDSVRGIRVAASDEKKTAVLITEKELDNYLPDDDRILPEFENGARHTLSGTILALQSAKGEIVKVRLDGVERFYSLVTAHPKDGDSTENYTQFYKKRILFTAEVVRSSMYKRPEFIIIDASLEQEELL